LQRSVMEIRRSVMARPNLSVRRTGLLASNAMNRFSVGYSRKRKCAAAQIAARRVPFQAREAQAFPHAPSGQTCYSPPPAQPWYAVGCAGRNAEFIIAARSRKSAVAFAAVYCLAVAGAGVRLISLRIPRIRLRRINWRMRCRSSIGHISLMVFQASGPRSA